MFFLLVMYNHYRNKMLSMHHITYITLIVQKMQSSLLIWLIKLKLHF